MNAPVACPAIAKKAHLWDRDPFDWYIEPVAATEALLARERFVGAVWDPACGQGNVIRALAKAGIPAYGTDVVDRGLEFVDGFRGLHDFLKDDPSQILRFALPSNIVCNPPFFRATGTEDFIRRALTLAAGKVAIFADIKFLAGGKRAGGLYAENPPSRVYILAKRPSCPPGALLRAGGKAQGGTADWCWLVWDLAAPTGDTRMIWLRAMVASR